MTQFDRLTLGRQAKELGFVRDTFEKVCRLADVLSFMESDPVLSDTLKRHLSCPSLPAAGSVATRGFRYAFFRAK